jgi:hypothetical protein
MTNFSSRFPLHELLFTQSAGHTVFVPQGQIAIKKHMFIFGPCVKKSLHLIQDIIESGQEVRLFWMTNEGSMEDVQEFDHLFVYPYIELYPIQGPLELAQNCTRSMINLNMEVLLFCEKTCELEALTQELLQHVITCYYIKNEYVGFKQAVEQITDNLKDHACWKDIKKASLCFKDQPLLLLGSGPSLDEFIDEIPQCQDKMMIMSAGSTSAILHDHHIIPDFAISTCPNLDSVKRLKNKQQARVLFTTPRCHPELFFDYQGEKVVLPLFSHQGFETLSQIWGPCPIISNLPPMASTSVALGLCVAIYLGFNPIFLGGVDLEYGEKKYAHNFDSHWENERFLIEKKALDAMASQSSASIFSLGKSSFSQVIKPIDHQEFLALLSQIQDPKPQDLSPYFEKSSLCLNAYLMDLEDSYRVCKDKWDWPLKEVHLEQELAFCEFLKHSQTLEGYDFLAKLSS